MAITNHERVGKSLELLNAGLKPFVEREMLNAHGEKWFEIARQSTPGNDRLFSRMKRPLEMETQALLALVCDSWCVTPVDTSWKRYHNRHIGRIS